MDVLNGFLGRMTEIVIAHGGTINEFIGDAIFAVFGAPVEHADHAERAAATALAMQRANDALNRPTPSAAGPSSRWVSACTRARPSSATSVPSSGRSTRSSAPP
jgi:class 3 adenylate cyclase